ncbi:MAG: lytic murein transglycosylase B [Methylococcales bacterium]|nr:lytic murein transglycosylase B [Methylococcales bacterium]
MKKIFINLMVIVCFVLSHSTMAAIKITPEVTVFMDKMVKEYDFKQSDLTVLFQAAKTKQSILKAMSRPAEGHMTWGKYRKIFLTKARIAGGVKFWQKNHDVLLDVEKKQGVPWQIIVAIIGVETQYGGNMGSFRVIDALATLAFSYPKRSQFFTSELENFLLLCRDEGKNPLEPKGSYAGAMGLPQFMPSSYRNYAVDYEQDKQRNIWSNPADAIASVGNYLSKYGWQRDKTIAHPVTVTGNDYLSALSDDLKPSFSLAQLKDLKVKIPDNVAEESLAKLLDYEQSTGKEFWVGLTNFYVITRYNHSRLYALAVYQLSQEILTKVKSGEN